MTTKTAVLTLRLDTDLMDLCKAIAKKELMLKKFSD
jgi:hypothetical protein